MPLDTHHLFRAMRDYDTERKIKLITVNNLTVILGSKKVIDNLSFQVSAGEIIGLVAPNGTGKTTILNALMNYVTPNSGSVSIKQLTYKNKRTERTIHKHISMMPDQGDLYGYLTGWEHLKLFNLMWPETLRSIDKVVEALNMGHYIHNLVRDYSLGMRQRLSFAMQIAANTDIMLMDEVMNGLDPTNVELISRIILEKKQEGKTILIASHLLNNLESYADRVFFIKNGGIIHEVRKEEQPKPVLKLAAAPQDLSALTNLQVHYLPNGTPFIEAASLDHVEQTILTLLKAGIQEFSLSHLNLNDLYSYYFENTQK